MSKEDDVTRVWDEATEARSLDQQKRPFGDISRSKMSLKPCNP
jgi:hypothetical protein